MSTKKPETPKKKKSLKTNPTIGFRPHVYLIGLRFAKIHGYKFATWVRERVEDGMLAAGVPLDGTTEEVEAALQKLADDKKVPLPPRLPDAEA